MSVAEARNTKINYEGVPARRVRDVRSFQRYAAAVILPIPPTARHRTTVPNRRHEYQAGARLDRAQSGTAVQLRPARIHCAPRAGSGLPCRRSALRRRTPVLTTVAVGVNLVAYVGAFAMGAIDNLYLIGALLPPEQRDVAAIVIDKMWSSGIPGVSTSLFVLGHILGAILMGLALRGSIATVGWLAMLLTTPMHVLAFVVLQMPALDLAAWLLMTLAFVCCAVKIIKTPNDEWDLPPFGHTR